ncbi:hypothetical protein R6Q57_022937 [Mikania cordata]
MFDELGPSTNVIAVSSPDLACEFFKIQDEIFFSRPDFLSTFLISNGYISRDNLVLIWRTMEEDEKIFKPSDDIISNTQMVTT